MSSYFKLYLGSSSKYVDECIKGSFVGVHYGVIEDLTNILGDNWEDFNKRYIPTYQKMYPKKSNRAAGLSCATIWMVSKGMKKGDILLCPNGEGIFLVCEIVGDYCYQPNQVLPHSRAVKWYSIKIPKVSMSPSLQRTLCSSGTYSSIREEFIPEIEKLLSGQSTRHLLNPDLDSSSFAFERHLEDFLVQNWEQTELGKKYDLYEDEDEDGRRIIGKQIPTDTGRIDILAISKDKTEFLVIELKNNKASDQAVGQVQRYMGYVKSVLANPSQKVSGLIVALEDDLSIRRALTVTQNIEFWRYEVSFKLSKAA